MNGVVLIIDDEEGLRKTIARLIALDGFVVMEANDGKTARKAIKDATIDVVLCDVKLPDADGVTLIKEIKKALPLAEIILLTAFGNIRDGVQAIKNGAFDYLVKGDDNDRLLPLLHQAIQQATLAKESAIRVRDQPGKVPEIIGKSKSILVAKELAQKAAATPATVLLLGETGTGKEVFASYIHKISPRKHHPFVAINCSAFASHLLESELFGYKTGAFTGAVKDKKGLFEVAHGGSLLLDELGEMSLELQAKLLRVLESGEFIKLGDVKTTQVDVRIMAATNIDLKQAVNEGKFRSDLFYRVNVFSIELPALRERADDIPELASHFLRGHPVTPEATELLQKYSWPGNIRELRNIIERALILCGQQPVAPEHLPYEIQHVAPVSTTLSLASIERQHIARILDHTNGNKTRAAQVLGIGLSTLYRKMEEYGIDPR